MHSHMICFSLLQNKGFQTLQTIPLRKPVLFHINYNVSFPSKCRQRMCVCFRFVNVFICLFTGHNGRQHSQSRKVNNTFFIRYNILFYAFKMHIFN